MLNPQHLQQKGSSGRWCKWVSGGLLPVRINKSDLDRLTFWLRVKQLCVFRCNMTYRGLVLHEQALRLYTEAANTGLHLLGNPRTNRSAVHINTNNSLICEWLWLRPYIASNHRKKCQNDDSRVVSFHHLVICCVEDLKIAAHFLGCVRKGGGNLKWMRMKSVVSTSRWLTYIKQTLILVKSYLKMVIWICHEFEMWVSVYEELFADWYIINWIITQTELLSLNHRAYW